MIDTDSLMLARVSYEIETLGFSVVNGVVSAAECAALRAALLEALDDDARRYAGLPGKKVELVNNLAIYGGPFLALMGNSTMRTIFAHFLTPACILYNFSSTVLYPQAKSDVQNIHVDSPRVIPGYHDGLIMTLALDDFNDANGATYYLPGSQNSATPPDAATFDRFALSVARPAGAAVFFNPRCFHRGGHNQTERVRCGLTVFSVRPFMKQRFDFPRMIDPETAAQLPAATRAFLGYDARTPSAMEEFYVDAERRLYKAGQE
ncbi:MAG TPA: phytanoyl-CoA dioxygenase family protein [Verrucomicrobiae bacterium]|nr:phytanoyl-CoA dioxygenase family protein [Verrucomicrobiae bacterium]